MAANDVHKPKIILLSNTSWSFTRFRMSLVYMLLSEGYEVLLLAPEDADTPKLEASGARYLPIKHLRAKGLNPLHDLAFIRELRRIYRAERPDVIIQYTIKPNIYSSWVAQAMGIPYLAVVTGLGYTFIKGGWITTITSYLYKRAFKAARNVWFLNGDDHELFVSRGIVDSRKTLVLPGEGIDATVRFNPDSVKMDREYPVRDSKIRFIFVGRLLFDKGIREYVSAARILHEKYQGLEFNVLGYLNVNNPSAVSEKQLRDWVDSGLIHYLGSSDDVRPVLLNQDCLVLPSYREGMSTTLMEAGALARPLIASNVAGCREIIDDGINGFLCEGRNHVDLAEKMERFIRLPKADREKMGFVGREKILAEFSEERVLRVYRDQLHRILKTEQYIAN